MSDFNNFGESGSTQSMPWQVILIGYVLINLVLAPMCAGITGRPVDQVRQEMNEIWIDAVDGSYDTPYDPGLNSNVFLTQNDLLYSPSGHLVNFDTWMNKPVQVDPNGYRYIEMDRERIYLEYDPLTGIKR